MLFKNILGCIYQIMRKGCMAAQFDQSMRKVCTAAQFNIAVS